MGENTKIKWATHTFNPWIGCTKVGPGCDHCYAEADFDLRKHRAKWGPGNPRSRTSVATWKKPLRWNRQARIKIDAWENFKATQPGLTDGDLIAQGFVKPERPRVFCASLGDVFDNAVPTSWRADLFELIEKTPHLDWLLVTKRIGNVGTMLRDTLSDIMRSERSWPWPNVWLGITVCNQAEADRDIPKLLEVPARVRFLSMEPLLGPVNLARIGTGLVPIDARNGGWGVPLNDGRPLDGHRGIDWVIAGGESGPKARPSHPDWFRTLRDQCAAAGVPFLFKQWGEWAPAESIPLDDKKLPERWLHRDGQVFGPNMGTRIVRWANGDEVLFRAGNKTTGRLLDGVLHDGYPEVRA